MGNSFCVRIDPDKMTEESWNKLNRAMDELFDQLGKEAEGIAKEFGVTIECALDIQYLRTRSRWTQEAEDRLIKMGRDGYPERPNICDWS